MDDATLVELARRDGPAGWAAIWDAHGDALHGYCARMLGDRGEADDVVADVFLVGSRRLDQLRRPEALRAWLFAIGRRRVQQRWRERRRTVPVDPQRSPAMTERSHTDDVPLSGDAAELLEAAAAGLSAKDRELLALTLGADLDTTEVARVTGQAPNAVSVRVTRLKDAVGRAAGALLVARHHRRDCDELDAVLADWDGGFDTVWRKRIARHIDGCATCDDRRRGAVAAFASPLLLAPPASSLRDRVLEPVVAGSPVEAGATALLGDVRWDDDGFPRPRPWSTGGARLPAALVAAVLVVVAVVLALLLAGDEPEVVETADDSPTSEPASPVSTTITTAAPTSSTTTSTTPTTTPPDLGSPVDPPGDAPVTTAPPVVTPPGASDPPPPPPSLPSPRVQLTVTPDLVQRCGTPARVAATVVVTAGAGDESTTVSWGGGQPGEVVVDGAGDHVVDVGPLTRAQGGVVEDIPVSAVATDRAGQQASADTTVRYEVVPC